MKKIGIIDCLKSVEDAFRQLKDLVGIRPIFHFRKRRVKNACTEIPQLFNICLREFLRGKNPLKRVVSPQTPLFPNFLTKTVFRVYPFNKGIL